MRSFPLFEELEAERDKVDREVKGIWFYAARS